MMMKFVNLYKHHECLWQTHNAKYKNKEARHMAVQNIVEEMAIPDFGIADCKNKIKNLRSHYCQELKKIQESKNNGALGSDVYQPTLVWFSTVDGFLRSYVQQSNNIPRCYAKTKQYTIKNEPEDMEEDYQLVSNFLEDSEFGQQDENESFLNDDKVSLKRCYEATNFNEPEVILKTKKTCQSCLTMSRLVDRLQDRLEKKDNEFDIFGKSVAIQLNNMPLDKAAKLQLKIQTLLTQDRLEELSKQEFSD